MNENLLSVIICRSIEDVFEFTINPINTPKWIDGLVEERTSQWPIEIGTLYKNRSYKGAWAEYVVNALVRNELFELAKRKSSYSVRYTYRKIEKDMTELTYREWVTDGFLENPFEQACLDKLKSVLEAPLF